MLDVKKNRFYNFRILSSRPLLTGVYESGCPEAGGYTTFIRLADKFTWIKGAIVSMRHETTTTTTTSTTTTSTTTTTTSTTQDTVLPYT